MSSPYTQTFIYFSLLSIYYDLCEIHTKQPEKCQTRIDRLTRLTFDVCTIANFVDHEIKTRKLETAQLSDLTLLCKPQSELEQIQENMKVLQKSINRNRLLRA